MSPGRWATRVVAGLAAAAVVVGVPAHAAGMPMSAVASLSAVIVPTADDDEPAERGLAPLQPYRSAFDDVERSIPALSDYRAELAERRRVYLAHRARLSDRQDRLRSDLVGLAAEISALEEEIVRLDGKITRNRRLVAAKERSLGRLVRSVYQLPDPSLTAFAQMMSGEDLRSTDTTNLLGAALAGEGADLERLVARGQRLATAVSEARRSRDAAVSARKRTKTELATVDARLGSVRESLDALAADDERAQRAIRAIRAAQAAALASAGAAAGVPKGDDFVATLPAGIPYRDSFLRQGNAYGVEPALLAAIAAQESGFNPYAGCLGSVAGKGIMQHEGQSEYCGPDKVDASIAKSAGMLAGYYRASGSWNAAVFAYNNGPGLMDEWLQYNDDPPTLIGVLAAYYDRQSYARPGAYQGYSSWGQWRARVAYSYASASPLPGFHSVITRWLQYRAG